MPCSPATQTHVGPLDPRPAPEYVPVIFSQEVSGTLLGQPWVTNRASRSCGLCDEQTQDGAGQVHGCTRQGQGERPSAGPGPRDTPGSSRALQLATDPAVLTQLWDSHFASRGPSRPRSPGPQGLTRYTAGASPSRRPAALSGGLRNRRPPGVFPVHQPLQLDTGTGRRMVIPETCSRAPHPSLGGEEPPRSAR